VAYLLPSLAAPTLRLPSRQRLVLLRNRAVTITCWAVALTLTAGRLVRIGFEWARPYLAKALHALAIALDGGLAFPDQPEPDPTPDLGLGRIGSECPSCGRDNSEYGNVCTSDDCPAAPLPNPDLRMTCSNQLAAVPTQAPVVSQAMAAGELIASSRPRARRRTTKAAPKVAA
jgi:hypothetical protein